mgnify:CR=1 FL=1|tara:strand:- start:4233 stop:4400 length:168 start_codon:yes stop_codon:yes gene_type:complete
MNKQELFEQIVSHFEEFEAHHSGTTKVSQRRARAAIGSIKKLITPYKKASVAESK